MSATDVDPGEAAGPGLAPVLGILRRRAWLGIAVFTGIFVAVASVVWFLPEIYLTTATILIERQQIPTDLVKSTVTGDLEVRLQTISQEILSRSRLEGLVDRFGLYADLRQKKVPMEEVLERMREDIRIGLRGSSSRDKVATVAFNISYRGRDPRTVALVTNTIASFFIEENLKVRERQAMGTAEFLRVQLDDTKKKLDELEKRVATFRETYMGELPQQLDANLRTLEQLNLQLRLNSESETKAVERRASLVTQMGEATGTGNPGDTPPPESVRLAQLQKVLAALRTRYSDKYPDVVQVKAEIERLEKKIAEGNLGEESATTAALDPRTEQIKKAIVAEDLEIRALKAQAEGLRASIAAYQRRVENAPRREQQFQALSREYETTKQVYQSLTGRHREAELAENMEQRQKGEQFRILDPAIPSQVPAAPNRPQLIAIGLFIALLAAAVSITVAEQADTSFHSAEDLQRAIQTPVIVSIPRILTAADNRARRRRIGLTAVASVLALGMIVGGSYYVARGNARLTGKLVR